MMNKLNYLFIFCGAFLLNNLQAQDYSDAIIKKATEIHFKVLTIDSHTDTPMWFTEKEYDFALNNKDKNRSAIDIPRMEDGGLDAVFLAAFVGQGERTALGNASVKLRCDNIIESIHKVAAQNHAKAEIALNPEDAYRLEKEGKRALFIGIENGYPIGNNIDLIDEYYQKGARYITLCHTKNNDICDSSTDESEEGLTKFGKKVVKRMNRLGMLIDISHASDQSFYDVIKQSKAPIIASHSCSRAICDSPRNLSDEMLLALKKNGGVIQMCILNSYVKYQAPNPAKDSAYKALRLKYRNFENLSEEEQSAARRDWRQLSVTFPDNNATVKDIVDHIDHMVKIAGIDHVGIGTDFDGGGGVSDCSDASHLIRITYELVDRGYTEEQIRKIWGGNFMRVFDEVIRIARK